MALTQHRANHYETIMASEFLRQRALELWTEGAECHLRRDFDGAVECYNKSIQICPTAEALTFRGWAYSAMGRIDDAIAECKRAIEVDPSFGNPYNDIGAYLIAKGELDEAIDWLERAKLAERYEPRHFPHMNLGRVYALKGHVNKAIEEFQNALRLCPDDPTCTEMLARLRAMLN